MPKIISYTPRWLSQSSPGLQLFNTADSPQGPAPARRRGSTQYESGSTSGSEYVGPNKTIARRGTEVFVVAGKQIRWSDLCMLKDDWQELQQTPSKKPKPANGERSGHSEDDGPEDGSYRILKVPVSEQIRQLSVSPNGDLLAIATSHTVHLAILPYPSHLGQIPNKAIRLKTYTIGPTTHVLSQSQLADVLWHPCGVAGNCLVTVTADAIVRLWEFNKENRWSSDSPSLAVDLKKLVTGSSEEENFAPDRFGRNRGFSSDAVGLEVASACFGGTGSSGESAWSSMTLWLAMKEGDLYALCPFLPSKWQPSSSVIPLLSTAIVAKVSIIQKDNLSDDEESRQCHDQLQWIQDIDSQDPQLIKGEHELSLDGEVYDRPCHRSSVPRLQGPFQMFPEDTDEDLELSDIHVIAAKIDPDELMSGDDSDSEPDSIDELGVSAAVVCLVTRSGRVYVCLDLEGVEGQWLPRKKPKHLLPPPKDPYLVVLEGLETLSQNDTLTLEWPTLTRDVNSRYAFFITHSVGVLFFSLEPWLLGLENEMQSHERKGAHFRLDVIRSSGGALRERILSFNHENEVSTDTSVSACLAYEDSELGYFLLTSAGGRPHAVTFDRPYPEPASAFETEDDGSFIPEMRVLALGPARSAYQAPLSLWEKSKLPKFFDENVPNHQRMIMKKEKVRMSMATLDIMTKAHRVLSHETHRLGVAAADLFRRCERLQDELRDQIGRANEVAYRTERIIGKDADAYLDDVEGKDTSLNARLDMTLSRHEELIARHESLKRKFARVSGKVLSEKEQQWFSEVKKINESVERPEASHEEDEEAQSSQTWRRLQEVKDLAEDLIERAKASGDGQTKDGGDVTDTMIPLDLRRKKVEQVMSLLERESALVEAAQSRLERLNRSSVA